MSLTTLGLLQVTSAPFFIVSEKDVDTVYTLYFKLKKEVLGAGGSAKEENREIASHMAKDLF